MIFRHEHVDLTPDERRLYASLRTDSAITPGHEDRTLAALRAQRALGARPDAPAVPGRRWPRAAVGVAAIFLVLLGASSLFLFRSSVRPPAAKPTSYLVWY